jgi:hypothetical protein
VLFPRTGDRVTFHGKRDFTGVLMVLRWRKYSGVSDMRSLYVKEDSKKISGHNKMEGEQGSELEKVWKMFCCCL